MKVPLLAMTILGLSLIGYGLFTMLQKNPEFRAEVMRHLPPDQQIQLTNLLNNGIDLGYRAGTAEAVDPTTICISANPQDCKPGDPGHNQPGHPPHALPGAQPQPAPTGNLNPATANPADALIELQNIKKNQEEAKKALDQLMKE